MPIYTENQALSFDLQGDGELTFEITTFDGTEASVSFGFPPKTVNSDSRSTAFSASAGATLIFTGSMNNPMNNNNKIRHTITQGGNSAKFTFPDDYSGSDYTPGSGNTDYQFTVKF